MVSDEKKTIIVEPMRKSSKEAHKKVKAGEAILVCGYDDEAKFKAFRLEMAIPFSEFRKKLGTLSKDQ